MTFEQTFGNIAGSNDLRYYHDKGGTGTGWPAGSDDPGPGYAIWQAVSSGSPTTALTADAQIVGRLSGSLHRTVIRFTLPDKPYNDNLNIEDCLIRIKWAQQLGSPPTIAVYEMSNTLDVTNISWQYVSVSGTAFWTPSHTGEHDGGDNKAFLQDANGNFFDNELKGIGTVLGSKVFNITDGSSGTIGTVDSNIKVSSLSLSGGTDDDFDNGDAYVISGGCAFNTTNDYGFGPNGIVDVVAPAATSDYTNISLKNYFRAKKPEWGQSYGFLLKAHNEAILGSNDVVRHQVGVGGSTSVPQIVVKYDNPTPNTPLIEVTPQSDGINANITFVDGYTKDDDLQSYVAVFRQAADPAYLASGVSGGTYGATFSDVGKELFVTEDLTSDGSNSFLKTDNTEYRLQFYAQDNDNTGSATLASAGNIVSITRPGIDSGVNTAVDDTAPTVGKEITLTITATGGMFSGKCKRFGVNWDSGASDTDDDYSFVELDSPATSTTIKHRYSSGGAKAIKVQVEDELGFRSSRVALSSQPTVVTPSPVAVPRLSRTEVMNTDFNDSAAAFYVTGQHSYPVGNNRFIAQYKYKTTDANNFITSFALDNDNSRFEDSSKQLQLKSSLPSCGDTTLKVYGLVSKDEAGSDVVDTDNTFSHYEWAVVELEPADSHSSGETDAFGTASDEFFKRIDMVVLKDIDSVDNFLNVGSRYTLCTHSSTAADDNLIVNAQIRGTKLSYTWGGSAVANPDAAQTGAGVDAQNITVAVTNSDTITDTGDADFLTEGFAPGDYIIITGHSTSANNGTFRIKNEYDAVTETVLKLEDTPLTNAANTTCKIIKDTSHLTSISCASDDVHSNTISHLVRDDNDQESSQVETATINIRSDSNQYWDMDVDVANGKIAILSSSLTRTGGISGSMALGDKRYPVGVVQTKLGMPTYSLSIRTLKQSGYIKLWSLLEGDRYGWATIDANKVGAPYSAYKQLRIRCTGGNIQQDPANADQYIGNLQFIVLGEFAGG
tara:strand:- start:1414 stop:4422 length:3009 start_codon:yes stop_codon:yes gene_type:complete